MKKLLQSLIAGWVLLTAPNGSPMYFNTTSIVAVQRGDKFSLGTSMITLAGGNQYYVKESPKEVVDMLKKEDKDVHP